MLPSCPRNSAIPPRGRLAPPPQSLPTRRPFRCRPRPCGPGHHRISVMIPGLAFHSVAMCFRAWRAYCCPGPGSSDAIHLMAACASVKIVTRSGAVFLLEAKSNDRARAAHSTSNASWLCPMCVLTPTQDTPFLHTTAYPVAPSSSRDPSVNMVRPGQVASDAAFASASPLAVAPRRGLPAPRTARYSLSSPGVRQLAIVCFISSGGKRLPNSRLSCQSPFGTCLGFRSSAGRIRRQTSRKTGFSRVETHSGPVVLLGVGSSLLMLGVFRSSDSMSLSSTGVMLVSSRHI